MISISQALEIIKRETFSSLSAEMIDLEHSIGRVLAQSVEADMDLPPFDRSQMDGFALSSKDAKNAPVRLKIIGESIAGNGFDEKVKSGEAVRIMTGARVPTGANAVQKVELTREFQNEAGEGFVEILKTAEPEQNLVKRGGEIKRNEKIFSKGERVTENMIASLASFGYAEVKVFEKPSVSILSTGSEIVGVSQKPGKDQIRNSNSIMLEAFAKKAGAKVEVLPLVRDDFETLKTQIAEAVGLKSKVESPKSKVRFQSETSSSQTKIEDRKSEFQNPNSKILIISGGVSVGDYDFTKPVLRELGAEIFFERVSLKPGKPSVFARLNETLVFGLPGNPVSSAVTFYLFVRPAILRMQGASNCELEGGFAAASKTIKAAKERDSFLPVRVETNEKGLLIIESLRFGGSSNFVAFARANALAFVPRGKNFERGEIIRVAFLS